MSASTTAHPRARKTRAASTAPTREQHSEPAPETGPIADAVAADTATPTRTSGASRKAARAVATRARAVKPADDVQAAEPAAAESTPVEATTLLFDPDWYRAEYPDVAQAGVDPVRHYFDDGAREGRNPNAFFSTSGYLQRYGDVAASRMNPFLHYLLYGAREGRNPAA